MRDGIFSFYIRSEETAVRAIALVEKDSIRGFNKSHIYSVERLESSLNRLRKDRNTNWRVKATAYTRQGVSMRGFPARLEGEEGEEQFWFEGGSGCRQVCQGRNTRSGASKSSVATCGINDSSEALSRRLASFDCYRRACCVNAAIIIDELQD
jgi:hypothetical protein